MSEAGNQGGFSEPRTVVEALAGLGLVAGFIWHASVRGRHALIDVSLFTQRGFASAAATNFLLGVALFGSLILLPLYYQSVRQESPLATGLLLVPNTSSSACSATGPAKPRRSAGSRVGAAGGWGAAWRTGGARRAAGPAAERRGPARGAGDRPGHGPPTDRGDLRLARGAAGRPARPPARAAEGSPACRALRCRARRC
jgi:hypothetical protein